MLGPTQGWAGGRGARAGHGHPRGGAQAGAETGLLDPWAGDGRDPGQAGQGHQGPLVPAGHTILGELHFLCFCLLLILIFKPPKAEAIMLKLS